MKTSETQSALIAALFAARHEFPNIAKNKEGQAGNRKFKYAPLDEIMSLIEPVLYKNGLMITQPTEGHELVTRLEHISGEWRESRMPINVEHANMQSYGIELTYCRRYAVPMILGIVTQEDIDIAARNRKTGKDHTATVVDDQPRGVAAAVLAVSEPLTAEVKASLASLAESVSSDFEAYGAQAAWERIDEQGLEDIEKIYLSTLMGSTMRNQIKAYHLSLTQKATA